MNKTFNALFYVKKRKTLANGTAPIYLRITVDGKVCEITTKRHIEPDKWNSIAQKVNGTTEDVKALNSYLKSLEHEVFEAQHHLVKDRVIITAEIIKNKLLGIDRKKMMLVPIFEDHNRKFKEMVGREYAPATLPRYQTTVRHVKQFMKWKYNISDIDIKDIDHAFVTEFEFFLRTERNCANNSAVKYIKNFGKIIRICINNHWIEKDPFSKFKPKLVEVKRVFLNEEELQIVINKQFNTVRLNKIRDIFVFSCFKGLAYADARKLDKSQIVKGIDGENWIYTSMQKTDSECNIPILPVAQNILDKYAHDHECISKGILFAGFK